MTSTLLQQSPLEALLKEPLLGSPLSIPLVELPRSFLYLRRYLKKIHTFVDRFGREYTAGTFGSISLSLSASLLFLFKY